MDGLFSLTTGNDLTGRWRRLRDADPLVSLPDAASRLDVVEAELVSSFCGDGVLRLDGPFGDLIRVLPELGRVRAVTRNAHATIETCGTYPAPELGSAGVAGEIGARFHPERWRHGYALDETFAPDGAAGLLFYDERGDAVHELHAEIETRRARLATLVDLFASFDQSPGDEIALASPHLAKPRPECGTWLRQAEHARPVPVDAVRSVLAGAVRDAVPISIAVRSSGAVHRFSGLLHEVSATPTGVTLEAPWVRARLETSRIAEVWTICAPSLDGPMTSLELLDRAARVVVSLAAARWPGRPEPEPWRRLVESLARP